MNSLGLISVYFSTITSKMVYWSVTSVFDRQCFVTVQWQWQPIQEFVTCLKLVCVFCWCAYWPLSLLYALYGPNTRRSYQHLRMCTPNTRDTWHVWQSSCTCKHCLSVSPVRAIKLHCNVDTSVLLPVYLSLSETSTVKVVLMCQSESKSRILCLRALFLTDDKNP